MIEPEEASALFVLALLTQPRQRKARRKRMWVHPSLQNREKGAFSQLYPELLSSEEKFFNYFHMPQSCFEELHGMIQHKIQKKDTLMRSAIPTKERLAITLRYLASGCTLTDLCRSFKCGISTISKMVEEVCEAIWELSSLFLEVPSKNEWMDIASNFKRMANFPHCLGAIAGKHIRIIKAQDNDSYSIVLLAICDSNYLFRAVDIGAFGSQSDSVILVNSNLWKRISSNTFNIPPACSIVEGGPNIEYVFVADEAFGLSKHMMRPFAGNSLTTKQKVFNKRLSRARRFIDCSFGILANKWRIFHRPLNVEVHFSENIVKACVILHNFVILRHGVTFEDTLFIPTTLENAEMGPEVSAQSYARQPRDMRNYFADYFFVLGELD
ncbi:protein ALP1-like [Trichonephila clavipes]|nr:protein ALP1-like [Trichonephila clavipes]